MKFLYIFFLFLISLNFTFCNPFSLEEDGRGGARDRDKARGEDRFEIPDIKDLNLEEVNRSVSESCADYKAPACFSILGKLSLARPACNCAAKGVDEGLKPLCDHERDLKEAQDYYERKRDRDKVEEIEQLLIEVEEMKYDLADDIFSMSDEFAEARDNILDDIDEHYDEKEDEHPDHGLTFGQTILKLGLKNLTRSESSVIRMLDSRARNACKGQFDLSKIRKRQ